MFKIGNLLRQSLVIFALSSFASADEPGKSTQRSARFQKGAETVEIIGQPQDFVVLQEDDTINDYRRMKAKLGQYIKDNGLTTDLNSYTVCVRKIKVKDDQDGWDAGDLVPSAIFKRPETVIRLPMQKSELEIGIAANRDGERRDIVSFPGSKRNTVEETRVDGEELCFLANKGKEFIRVESGALWEDKASARKGQHTVMVPAISRLSNGLVYFDFKLEEWDDWEGVKVDPIPSDRKWLPIALSLDPRDFVEGPLEARSYRTRVVSLRTGIEVEFEITQHKASLIKILKEIGEFYTAKGYFDGYLEQLPESRQAIAVFPNELSLAYQSFYGFAETMDRFSDFLRLLGNDEKAKLHASFLAQRVAPLLVDSFKTETMSYEQLRQMQQVFDLAQIDSRQVMVLQYRRYFFDKLDKARPLVSQYLTASEAVTAKAVSEKRGFTEIEAAGLVQLETDAVAAVNGVRRAAALVGASHSADDRNYSGILKELSESFEIKMAPQSVRSTKE